MYLSKANAQSNTNSPKIIPLTPNAAEFNRYGDYNVNPLTGRPDISIPIYKIISGSLEMPITLSYFAGGIKVNQVSYLGRTRMVTECRWYYLKIRKGYPR